MKYKDTRKKTLRVLPNLTSQELALVCRKSHNDYNAFEEEYEKTAKFKIMQGKGSDVEKIMIKLINKKSTPIKIQPQNDFYTFINYEWMKYIEREAGEEYIVQIDSFRLAQNKVYNQLMEIVKEYIKHNKTEKAKQVANVYHSFLHLLDNKTCHKHIDRYVSFLDKMLGTGNIQDAWKFIGIMNKNEVVNFGLPFVFSLNPDNKEADTFRACIYPVELSILDFEVYVNDGLNKSYKDNYRKQFFIFVETLFANAFGSNHGLNVLDVFDVESELLTAMGCMGLKEPNDGYCRINASDAKTKYSFDWDTVSKYIGFKDVPKFFLTGSNNYLKCTSELFIKNWSNPKWRTYFIYIYIRQVSRFNKTWRLANFEFCGKFMRGQEALFPTELIPVYGLSFTFNHFLSNEYIERYQNQQYIDYIKTLAKDLKSVFARKITRNTWLAPQTKKYALLKLKHFKLEIGSPKVTVEDPLLNYSSTDLWSNFQKIVKWRTLRLTKLEGKPFLDFPMIDFATFPLKLVGTQSYIVNAMYTPTQNGIYIPLGYVQKPFIDLDERGIEYNLAHIGYTLGHEMSHALDDFGSQYDYKGNLNDWWTPQDKAIFKRKQNDVIKQYEEYAKRDGIDFDASMSIGEDLADISGLSICEEYLKDFQDKNDDIIPIRLLSLKAFFVYIAFQSRQKISKKAINAQIKTNPHPLDKYRVNVPLSRLELFRDIYQVKKGDGMYWPSTDTIW